MNNEPPFNESQRLALRKTRGIWFGALCIQLPMPFIILPATQTEWIEHAPSGEAKQAMVLAAIFGIISLIVGMYRRNQIYKEHWRGDVIQPDGYRRGEMAFLYSLTVGALAIFMTSFLAHYPAPTIAAAPILLGLMFMNFPNGKPMRPAPPRIGEDGGLQ